MENKKQITIIIIAVMFFWLAVVGIHVIKNINIKHKSDGLGEINIKQDETDRYDDPYKDSEEAALVDSGYVVMYDNENKISEKGFITLKGHVYLPEQLTVFLRDNGFKDAETITIIPDSCKSDNNGSEFIALIDGSDKYIKVSQDYKTEDLSFELLEDF